MRTILALGCVAALGAGCASETSTWERAQAEEHGGQELDRLYYLQAGEDLFEPWKVPEGTEVAWVDAHNDFSEAVGIVTGDAYGVLRDMWVQLLDYGYGPAVAEAQEHVCLVEADALDCTIMGVNEFDNMTVSFRLRVQEVAEPGEPAALMSLYSLPSEHASPLRPIEGITLNAELQDMLDAYEAAGVTVPGPEESAPVNTPMIETGLLDPPSLPHDLITR
ncbi:hypothetical protein [Natronoglycomyces albus]|uniref:Lipoprotein n=1 Tax=Natronoglycomyces albus TaxID=2811108 RepID=A0A895XTB2_9ACTN|nr:hypothetical protein [Natronoglycomyces albus]QSB04878.1 hypothetical protein JQS30_14090 [Natronoglycomyces albus]